MSNGLKNSVLSVLSVVKYISSISAPSQFDGALYFASS